MKRAAAYDVAAQMMYAKQSLRVDTLVFDTSCNVHAPYNSLGMYRGWSNAGRHTLGCAL